MNVTNNGGPIGAPAYDIVESDSDSNGESATFGFDIPQSSPNPTPSHVIAASSASRAIDPELVKALQKEFRRLVDAEEFLDNLPALQGLADTTRRLVMTLGAVPAVPARGRVLGNVGGYDGYLSPGTMMTNGPQGARNPEQFGARAIRELVNLVPDAVAKIADALRTGSANSPRSTRRGREAEGGEAAPLGTRGTRGKLRGRGDPDRVTNREAILQVLANGKAFGVGDIFRAVQRVRPNAVYTSVAHGILTLRESGVLTRTGYTGRGALYALTEGSSASPPQTAETTTPASAGESEES